MFKFPYDAQTCYLEFGNVIETEKIVNVTTYDAGFSLELYSESQEFLLKSAPPQRTTWSVRKLRLTLKMSILIFLFNSLRLSDAYMRQ